MSDPGEKTYRVISEKSGDVWYQGVDLEKARAIADKVSATIAANSTVLITEIVRGRMGAP